MLDYRGVISHIKYQQITALSPPKTENRRAWNVRGIVQLLWSDPHGSSHPTSSKKIVGGFNRYLNEYIACLSRTNKTLISDHIWVKTFCKRQRLFCVKGFPTWFTQQPSGLTEVFVDVKSVKWSKRCRHGGFYGSEPLNEPMAPLNWRSK